MDLKELKSFQAIIHEGTFTKAALKLNYAQSTITNHIKKIEDELNVTLFLEGKSNQLTPEGEFFKQEIDNLIAYWENTKERLLNVSSNIQTIIKIGFVQPYDVIALPHILALLTKEYPKVQIKVIVGSTVELSAHLKNDEIDFAFCSLPHDDSLFYQELFKEEICCIASKTNTVQINSLNDFENMHLYRSGNGCPFRRKIETYLDSSVSNIKWEFVNNCVTVPYLIESNNYYGFLPKSIAHNTCAKIKIIDVPLPDKYMTIGLLSKQNFTFFPTVKIRLIEIIQEYILSNKDNFY